MKRLMTVLLVVSFLSLSATSLLARAQTPAATGSAGPTKVAATADTAATPTPARGLPPTVAASTAPSTPKAATATGTATAGATGTGAATKPARPAALVIGAGPNATIGQRRFQTFARQAFTDRQSLGVNVANGNLLVHARDVAIRGTGLSLVLDRFYNSQGAAVAGSFGNGWTLSTGPDVQLKVAAGGAVIYAGPSDFQVTFAVNGGGYTTPTGLDATLVKNGDGTFTLTFHGSGVKDTFTATGALTSVKDRTGNTIAFADKPDGTLATITDTQGRTTAATEQVYNGAPVIVQLTDPANRNTQYQYDPATGNLKQSLDAGGSQTNFLYDATNRLTRITDPLANIITIAYDASNRVQTIVRVTNIPAGTGPTTTFAYNSGSTVVTDPDNHTTTYTYDSMGRVTQATDALGHQRSAQYNPDSNVTQLTDAAGKQWQFTYTANNGESMTQAQAPTTAGGQPGAIARAAYADTANPYLPTSSFDPQGNQVNAAYDGSGNLLSRTNQLPTNNAAHATYNTNGTVATTTDALGRVTTYGYDSGARNLTSVAPPSPLGAVALTYDGLSRVATTTDGKGQLTQYTYDGDDRVVQEHFADGAGVAYAYDKDGNLVTEQSPAATTALTYDALNRPLTRASAGKSSSYSYDAIGNLLTLTDASGTLTYGYDAANRPTTLSDPTPGLPGAQTAFTYDSANRPLTTAYPNGVTLTRTYDNAGRLASIAGTKGATALTGFSYAHAIGTSDIALRSSMTNTVSGAVTSYGYDHVNRLNQASAPGANYEYSYDGVGNRTTANLNGASIAGAATYNAADELTARGATTFAYDGDGNETGRSAGLSGFAYNAANQTTSITPSGGAAFAMTYDGAAQFDRLTAGSASYAYTLAGLGSESNGPSTSEYVRTPGGGLLYERTAAGPYYYLFDGLGSVVALTDGSGAVVATYQYDPYGNLTASTGSVANPWRYAGGYLDGATGLLKLGTRYYDPGTGRFTQRDPLGGGYAYAGDNPVNFTDPSGLCDDGEADSCEPVGGPGSGGPDPVIDPCGPDCDVGAGVPSREVVIPSKIDNQLGGRGWTEVDVVRLVNNPVDSHPAINKTSSESATAYYGADGHYVVVEDPTGRVIQISDRNDPGWMDNTQDPKGVPIFPRG